MQRRKFETKAFEFYIFMYINYRTYDSSLILKSSHPTLYNLTSERCTLFALPQEGVAHRNLATYAPVFAKPLSNPFEFSRKPFLIQHFLVVFSTVEPIKVNSTKMFRMLFSRIKHLALCVANFSL